MRGGHHGLRRVLRRSVVGPAGNGARRRHGHTGPVRIRRRGGGVLRRGNAVLADAPSLDRLHRVAPPPVPKPARVLRGRLGPGAAHLLDGRLTLLVDAAASLGDALPASSGAFAAAGAGAGSRAAARLSARRRRRFSARESASRAGRCERRRSTPPRRIATPVSPSPTASFRFTSVTFPCAVVRRQVGRRRYTRWTSCLVEMPSVPDRRRGGGAV